MTENASPGVNPEEVSENLPILDDGTLEDYANMLREKILFGLRVYPFLSPTMLHVFLGTATSAKVWKPILNQLLDEGLVVKKDVSLSSPHDRVQSYTVLYLVTNIYDFHDSVTEPTDSDATATTISDAA